MSLDPKETRQRKEEQEQAKKVRAVLNPDFPYRPTEIDVFYFRLEKDPSKSDNPKTK